MNQYTKIVLTNCNSNDIPKELIGKDSLFYITTAQANSLSDWQQAMESIPTPTLILGCEDTPTAAWLAAYRTFPDIRGLYFENETQSWIDTRSLDVWQPEKKDEIEHQADPVSKKTLTESKKNPEPIYKPKIQIEKPSLQQTKQLNQKNFGTTDPNESNRLFDKELIQQIFLWSALGPTYKNDLNKLLLEANNRSARSPRMITRAQASIQDGQRAQKLADKALTHFKQLLPKNSIDKAYNIALTKILKETTAKTPRIRDYIKKFLKKVLQDQSCFEQEHKAKNQKSLLKPLHIPDGIHPNNLRFMQPSQKWTVLIDETGQNFDHSAAELNDTDKRLGKVIALAIPERSIKTLKPLKTRFHAYHESNEVLDNVVKTLTQSDVGVFGFSIKDDSLPQKQQWFDAINHLCQWVVRLLPIRKAYPTKIDFKIEQRGNHEPNPYTLKLIQADLESKLKTLDPLHFKETCISMEFIAKEDSPFNGYVDTVANCWSGRSNAKKRLKKSKWIGHCLLTPNQDAIERLFLAQDSYEASLSPQDWYGICEAIANEPQTSLLHTFLKQLGQNIQQNEALWMQYMDFINDRLRLKDYKLTALGNSLDWLETHKPEQSELPPIAQLYWHSAKLSQLNHEGKFDNSRLNRLISIANELKKEYAPECCQVLLRISTAMTNGFEFNASTQTLKKWLNFNVAIPGLLNHAKILSTLGQLFAFNGQLEKAVEYFDRAINQFKALSDQKMASKDIEQTKTYRTIALMDQLNLINANNWQSLLLTNSKEVRRLATSGNLERYQHHVFLRGLLHVPETFSNTIEDYLSSEEGWQIGDGHPWPLINAYRGWLFVLQGKSQKAKEYFEIATEQCVESDGITIHWIGAVIATLSDKLRGTQNLSKTFNLNIFKQELKKAPVESLREWQANALNETHGQRLARLQTLLPFNFH